MEKRMKAKIRVWYKNKMWYPDGDEEFLIDMDGDLLFVGESESLDGELYESNVCIPDDYNPVYMFCLFCLDRNGKEIYSGDIIKWPEQNYYYLVEWCPREMAYMLYVRGNPSLVFNTFGREFYFKKEISGLPEIIGNRYEKPDLVDKAWTSE
jgi:hypothetical protein